MTEITDYYIKVKSINELNLSQALAALSFFCSNIAPLCSQITFSDFVRNNVFIGTEKDAPFCIFVGFYSAPDKKENFMQKWRKEPNSIIHLPHIFWYLTENEEKDIKSLF